jgi:hypothetical protein
MQKPRPDEILELPSVDRVMVHLEYMHLNNALSRAFGTDLATTIQQFVGNGGTTVIELSQPNVHRASGFMFKMGTKIFSECYLEPAFYGNVRQIERQKQITMLATTVPTADNLLNPTTDNEVSTVISDQPDISNDGMQLFQISHTFKLQQKFVQFISYYT